MDLLKRRQEILAQNQKAEKTRGSGWHPADIGAEARELRGELFLGDRPIALQDDDMVYVVGDCVAKVQAALKAFLEETQARPAADLLGNGSKYQAAAVKYARLALTQKDQLSLSTQQWNYVNSALGARGIQVSMATAAVDR